MNSKLGIGIANSTYGLALIALWKRPLHIHTDIAQEYSILKLGILSCVCIAVALH